MLILMSIGALPPGLSVTVGGIGCTLQPWVDVAARLTVSVKLPLLVNVSVSVKVWFGARVNGGGSGDQASAAFCLTVIVSILLAEALLTVALNVIGYAPASAVPGAVNVTFTVVLVFFAIDTGVSVGGVAVQPAGALNASAKVPSALPTLAIV